MVLEIDRKNKNLLIKFIHPALPSHSFYWKKDFKDIKKIREIERM